MRAVKFMAAGQSLERRYDPRPITAGSRGFLRAVFDLSDDYRDCKVVAAFSDDAGNEWAQLVENGSCSVPDEVVDGTRWSVRLVAVRDGYRLTTNAVSVSQEVV